MKILVVDDEAAALSNFFAEIIDDPNWDYKLLRDSEAALTYAKSHNPDAAFLDINMPKMDGIELAQRLIALNSDIGIVFISGYAYNEDEIKQILGANLKGFCRKPYVSDTLYHFLYLLADRAPAQAKVKTFGLFDISVHGKSIRFSCAKSKELLALLIDKQGAHVPLDTAIAALWPDKPLNLSKRLYRDAVIRLKLTLKEHGLDGLVYFYRAELAVNLDRAQCDFWNMLNSGDFSIYNGEYLTQYAEWSEERQTAWDNLKANAR